MCLPVRSGRPQPPSIIRAYSPKSRCSPKPTTMPRRSVHTKRQDSKKKLENELTERVNSLLIGPAPIFSSEIKLEKLRAMEEDYERKFKPIDPESIKKAKSRRKEVSLTQAPEIATLINHIILLDKRLEERNIEITNLNEKLDVILNHIKGDSFLKNKV